MSIELQRNIDKHIGYIVITLLILLKPIKFFINPKNKNILVIRLWTLGESLHVLPIIKELKSKNYNIDVLTRYRSKPVFENNNNINKIINLSPKIIKYFWKYDYAIDTEPYFNISAILSFLLAKRSIGFSNLYRKLMYSNKIKYNDKINSVFNMANLLKPLNIEFNPDHLESINYSKKDKLKIDKLLNKSAIGIHLGMAETSNFRMWKLNNFKELIKKINKNYPKLTIVLTGSKSESELNNKIIKELKIKNLINISGTSIQELAYLMTKFKAYIANDTGTMHLSAAMGTKTIGLFGPNLPCRFGPFNKNSIGIYKADNLSCSPCVNPHLGSFKKCPFNGKCMDLIKVEDVFSELKKMLK